MNDATKQVAPAPRRYAYIDALRGWAILGVLVVHISQEFPLTFTVLNRYAEHGRRGVQLFYLLSALTLMLSDRSRRQAERFVTSNFFIRRFFRIAPMFYVTALFSWWYIGPRPTFWAPNGIGAVDLAATFLFLHGWSPYTVNSVVYGGWSVGVETWAYLIMPLMFRFISSWRRALTAVILTTIATFWLNPWVYSFWAYRMPPSDLYLDRAYISFWLPSQLPVFLIGAICFFLVGRKSMKAADSARDGTVLLVLAVYLLITFPLFGDTPYVPEEVLFSVAFLCLTYALSLRPSKLFVNPVTIFLGRISYSLYLVHFLVLLIIRGWLHAIVDNFRGSQRFPLAFIVITALACVVAEITYRLVELPGQQIGKRIIRTRESRAATLRLPPELDAAL
jgi:Predicted acyltransferases